MSRNLVLPIFLLLAVVISNNVIFAKTTLLENKMANWTMPNNISMKSDTTPKQQYEQLALHQIDVMPHYLPNPDSMFKFLSRNIRYPEIAKKHNLQGTVYVGFTVKKDGSIINITIKQAVNYPLNVSEVQGSFEKEAMRVVALMPKWKAGTMKGEPVDVAYILPIAFRL